MFKPLIRLTLVHLIWRQYSKPIIATVVAILAAGVLSYIHSDFIAFAKETDQNQYLGISYLIKWCAYLIVVILWLYFGFKSSPLENSEKVEKQLKTAANSDDKQEKDPFRNIRDKPKLKSRAESILNKPK